MGLTVQHKLAVSSTSVHSKRKESTHIKVHCPHTLWVPLAPVTYSDLGLQPMNEGWFLGGSALLLPGVDCLWSWLSVSGSCQVFQREMDEQLWWLLGIGWQRVSSDWWANTAPPAPQVKLVHPYHKATILPRGSYMMRRKGKEMRSRRFVKRADVGKQLRGRADSIIESCAVAAQTTRRFHSSLVIKTEVLLMHWWGLNISFMFIAVMFPAWGPIEQLLQLLWPITLSLCEINFFAFERLPVPSFSNHKVFFFFFLQTPVYVSFVTKAILWDRRLCHHTVSVQTS